MMGSSSHTHTLHMHIHTHAHMHAKATVSANPEQFRLKYRLNEYVKPIMDLLKETENLNLAPELLEPEAQSIEKVRPH